LQRQCAISSASVSLFRDGKNCKMRQVLQPKSVLESILAAIGSSARSAASTRAPLFLQLLIASALSSVKKHFNL
jgi:hypothetical protein